MRTKTAQHDIQRELAKRAPYRRQADRHATPRAEQDGVEQDRGIWANTVPGGGQLG